MNVGLSMPKVPINRLYAIGSAVVPNQTRSLTKRQFTDLIMGSMKKTPTRPVNYSRLPQSCEKVRLIRYLYDTE